MFGNMKKVDCYVKDSKKPVYSEINVSRNGVVYFPFKEEKETIDWIDNVVSEWWDDETI
ncbi:MAG: hypothetical protein LBQ87_10100 [Candidatus Fibromonas sp.]|jgi:hypothetical protein|nr:hypothetical protein [Candidatus Fibromonas sp.]